MSDLKRTAMIYDFDGTLARGNLQETTFIPNIGMSTKDFWDEVKARTRAHDADEILVYMHLMLRRPDRRGSRSRTTISRHTGRKRPSSLALPVERGSTGSMPMQPSAASRWSTTSSRPASTR